MPPSLHIPRIRPLMRWRRHNLNRLLALFVLMFWVAVIWWVKT